MYESINTNGMKKFKLDGHESAYCHIEMSEDGYQVNLISYQTCVCSLSRTANSWYFHCDGNYSRSTIRHIAWFLDEFHTCVSYAEVKDELLKAKKRNKKRIREYDKACNKDNEYSKHYRPYIEEYITICISNVGDYKSAIDYRVQWYLENGKRWWKYAKEPNYDYRIYGYSTFEGIQLP